MSDKQARAKKSCEQEAATHNIGGLAGLLAGIAGAINCGTDTAIASRESAQSPTTIPVTKKSEPEAPKL